MKQLLIGLLIGFVLAGAVWGSQVHAQAVPQYRAIEITGNYFVRDKLEPALNASAGEGWQPVLMTVVPAQGAADNRLILVLRKP